MASSEQLVAAPRPTRYVRHLPIRTMKNESWSMEREHNEPCPEFLRLSATTNVSVGAWVWQASSNYSWWEIITSICASCTKLVYSFLARYRLTFWPTRRDIHYKLGARLHRSPNIPDKLWGGGLRAQTNEGCLDPARLHTWSNIKGLWSVGQLQLCVVGRDESIADSLSDVGGKAEKYVAPFCQLMLWHSKQEVRPIPSPSQSRWSMVECRTDLIDTNLKERKICCCSMSPLKVNY